MTDPELIEYMAQVKGSDLIPEPYGRVPRGIGGWRESAAGPRLLLERLVSLGVMEMPADTTLIIDGMRQARAACRAFLSLPPESPSF